MNQSGPRLTTRIADVPGTRSQHTLDSFQSENLQIKRVYEWRGFGQDDEGSIDKSAADRLNTEAVFGFIIS